MFSRYLYSRVMESVGLQSIELILQPFEIDFLDSLNVKYSCIFKNDTIYYVLNPNDIRSLFFH